MVSPFCRNPVGISSIPGRPVLQGRCKPERRFERGGVATPLSFAAIDCLDKRIIAYCYINGNAFEESPVPGQCDLQPASLSIPGVEPISLTFL